MTDTIETRDIVSGFMYVIKRDVNDLGHPKGGTTKGFAPTEQQARKRARDVISP